MGGNRKGRGRKKKAGRSKGEVRRECKDKKKARNLIFWNVAGLYNKDKDFWS